MTESPNFANRTIWTADNLDVMRGTNSGSVDLIYLDPPFNSKADYAAPVGSQAAGAAFRDTWTLRDVDVAWLDLIEHKHPALWRVLMAAMTPSDKSYLAYMAVRLLEMRRLLAPTGSIYLHCDDVMSAHLRLVMDAVFGPGAYRAEIVWKRQSSNNAVTRAYGRIADRLLFYGRGDSWTWNQPYHELSDRELREYRTDADGRLYKCDNLTTPGARPGRQFTWRGTRPSATRSWKADEAGLEAMLARGEIELRADGQAKLRGWRRFLDDSPGQKAQNIWTDINRVGNTASERTGYPTQKPLALLGRIIAASSNPGDMVFDPFCGCATTMVAAERLGRQWAGCDIAEKARDLVVERLQADSDRGSLDKAAVGWAGAVTHRTDIPRRTDVGDLPPFSCEANRNHLYGEQAGDCAGCRTHFEARNLTVDHIVARARGGTDHLSNLQLLCGHCNSVKGDRGMEYLMARLQLA